MPTCAAAKRSVVPRSTAWLRPGSELASVLDDNGLHVGAGDADHAAREDLEGRALERHLERRGGGRVVDETIGYGHRPGITGTRDRHAEVHRAGSAAILDGREEARLDDPQHVSARRVRSGRGRRPRGGPDRSGGRPRRPRRSGR